MLDLLEPRADDDALSRSFEDAKPFHHLVIDNLLTSEFCRDLADAFPGFRGDKAISELGTEGGSHDQKDDLERQKQVLELYCARQGWTFEVIADLGSGMNYRKKGLKRLLNDVVEGRIGRLVITHKDRLLRFGAELVFAICAAKNVEVVILNQGEDTTFEEDLAKDVLEVITVFSARLYGSRSRKNQKLLDGVKTAVEASQSC